MLLAEGSPSGITIKIRKNKERATLALVNGKVGDFAKVCVEMRWRLTGMTEKRKNIDCLKHFSIEMKQEFFSIETFVSICRYLKQFDKSNE